MQCDIVLNCLYTTEFLMVVVRVNHCNFHTVINTSLDKDLLPVLLIKVFSLSRPQCTGSKKKFHILRKRGASRSLIQIYDHVSFCHFTSDFLILFVVVLSLQNRCIATPSEYKLIKILFHNDFDSLIFFTGGVEICQFLARFRRTHCYNRILRTVAKSA